MEQESKLSSTIRIRTDADASGVRPEDCQTGATFTIRKNANGETCVTEQRQGKNGKFTQYTLNVRDLNGNDRRISYLFEKHLSPLARAFGSDNPQDWDEKEIIATGYQHKNSEFWDVKLKAA